MTLTFYAPSVQTLERLHWTDAKQRKQLRDAMKREVYVPWGMHPSHFLAERMRELDRIAETHGVEPLNTHRHSYEYLNTGDTYCPTIVAHLAGRRFFVCDWGTLAEQEGVD